MKKTIILSALALGVSSAFAQDLTSKKGEPFLPETGDWSIGVDATPMFDYLGRIGSSTNAAPTWNNYGLRQSITGKYFVDANTAFRATLRLGLSNQKQKTAVSDFVSPTAITEPLAETGGAKYDQMKMSTRNVVLGFGVEKRRGKTRLQGIYGADVFVWGGSTNDSYKYGNKLTQSDNITTPFNENLDANGPAAYTTNFGTNVVSAIPGYANVDGARALKRKTGGNIGLGVRAFIGAEYFIFPKISIGGEFGWGVGYQLNTKNKATWDAEGTGTSGTQVGKELKVKDKTNGGGSFVLDTDRNASNSAAYNLLGGTGTIRLNFHF